MKRKLALLAVLAWAGAIVVIRTTTAQDAEEFNPFDIVSPDCPGYNHEDNTIMMLAQFQVISGVQTYYQLHGQWPSSWLDIVDEGLFVRDLYSLEGFVIDPDDGSLDYPGDVYYIANGEGGQAEVHSYSGGELPAEVIPIETPKTQEEYFLEMYEMSGREEILEYAYNIEEHKLYALLGMCQRGMSSYRLVHGENPPSWQEFLESGHSPVYPWSENPLSGEPMSKVGGPWSVVYERVEPNVMKFYHLGPDGEPPLVRFSY